MQHIRFYGSWTAVLLVVILTNVPAAVIKGTVTDSLTNTAVESVLVAVKGGSDQAYTDALGAFTLSAPNAIHDVPEFSWPAAAGTDLSLYGMDGVRVPSNTGGNLPDGIYLATVRQDGYVSTGKVAVTGGQVQAVRPVHSAGKTSAVVTLTFSHKYYNTIEEGAAEGDTNVTARLTMWFPDSSNTGPSGTLTPSAEITVSQDNTVIENLEVDGAIHIRASNTTIRNCKFGSLDIPSGDTYLNTVVEDCKISWVGRNHFTLRRCFMASQASDLVRVGGPKMILEDCFFYCTGPRPGDEHTDIVQEYPTQTGQDHVIRHNTMWIGMNQNACVFNVTNVLVEYNLLAGGGYTIYANDKMRVINNHFSTKFFPSVGNWGYRTGTAAEWTGNVFHETGAPCN